MRLILPVIKTVEILNQIIFLIVLARGHFHVAIILDVVLKLLNSYIFKFDVLFCFSVDPVVGI